MTHCNCLENLMCGMHPPDTRPAFKEKAMGESYVELMWRVVKDQELRAGFRDLEDAEVFAELIGGQVITLTHLWVKK